MKPWCHYGAGRAKSVRQEAGMWTTSSFEETTGISTTLRHWHLLRVRDKNRNTSRMGKFLCLYYFYTLIRISPPMWLYKSPLALCMHVWGANFLDMKVLQSLLKLHLLACNSQKHGETETERLTPFSLIHIIHIIHIPIWLAATPGEREQFPPVKEARALRQPPRCFGAGHAFAELPALSFGPKSSNFAAVVSHHESKKCGRKRPQNGYTYYSCYSATDSWNSIASTWLSFDCKISAFGTWTISSTSCQSR